MSQPSVAVVILNYNGKKYLERFLPSVYQSHYSHWDLYVADNGSTDDSIEFLLHEGFVLSGEKSASADDAPFSKYVIKMPQNYGFAEGYNVALRQIEADYYVLLNSDVEVPPHWIEPVIALMESDAQIAACQPKIRMYDRKELFEHAGAAGGWIDKWGYPFCRGRIFDVLEEDQGQYNTSEEIFWASGAAMFVRARLYHALGGLDGDFFAHMEEIDLCWRLKRANYKIMVCADSWVWHVGGGTLPMNNPRKDFLNFRNSLAMIYKNAGRGWRWWIWWIRLWLDGLALFRFLVQKKGGNAGAVVRAHWAFLRWIPQLNRKRKLDEAHIRQYCFKKAIFNDKGVYRKSIVWAFFARKKRTFKEL